MDIFYDLIIQSFYSCVSGVCLVSPSFWTVVLNTVTFEKAPEAFIIGKSSWSCDRYTGEIVN